MLTHQTRPVAVAARQFDGTFNDASALEAWARRLGCNTLGWAKSGSKGDWKIEAVTLPGKPPLRAGDWLVRDGMEFCVYSSDLFEQVYEPLLTP